MSITQKKTYFCFSPLVEIFSKIEIVLIPLFIFKFYFVS